MKTKISNSWFAWIGVALLSGLLAFPLQHELTRFPRGLLTDDAYFYVKIAWHLGTQGLSSFDGIHITDGYHLVWGWLLGGISGLTGLFTLNPWFHLGAMLWFYFMICWAIGLWFGRTWLDVLLLFSLGIVFKVLMETTLLALLLLILCEREYLSDASSLTGKLRWRWRPLLLMLIPLVRLDAALILGVMSLASLFTSGEKSSQRWKSVFTDCAWIATGVGLQLGAHFFLFGGWTTVSMQLKGMEGLSTLERLKQNFSGFYGSNLISIAVFFVLWMMASAAALFREKSERLRHMTVLAAPAVFVLFHLIANNVINYWYFVPAAYVHVWYFLRFGPRFQSRWGWAGRAAIFLLSVLFLFKWVVDSRIRDPQIQWAREFVEEVKLKVPTNEPIYQIDASGWVGWFSERKVVNGDGLVNTREYARRLREKRLQGYLREEGIHYVIQNTYPEDDLLIDQAGLQVSMDSVETLIPPPLEFPRLTALGLYRLK